MMGKSHAQMAGVSWVVVLAGVHRTVDVPAVTAVLSTAVAVAAGVCPDIDHPGSGISRNFGIIGRLASRVVRHAAGGHRLLTHTLGASMGAAAVMVLASTWQATARAQQRLGTGQAADIAGYVATAHRVAMGVLVGLLVAVALDLMPRVSEIVEWCGAIVAGVLSVSSDVAGPWWLLPAAVAWGWHAHIICDRMTYEPIPYLWPLAPVSQRTSWRWFKTGSPREHHVVWLGWAVCIVLTLQVFRPGSV